MLVYYFDRIDVFKGTDFNEAGVTIDTFQIKGLSFNQMFAMDAIIYQ